MIPLYGISNFLIAITSLAISILVFVHGAQNKTNRIWVMLSMSIATYGFGAYMVSLSRSPDTAFFWWQIAYIGIIMIPIMFYHFVCSFLGIKRPRMLKIMYAVSFAYLLLCFLRRDIFLGQVSLFFKDSKIFAPGYWVYPASPFLKSFIIFFFIGTAIVSHIEMIKGYRKTASSKNRNQIRYFFLGTITGFIGGGTSFLPCFGIAMYPVFNIALIIYPLITSYTIFKYRLMELSVVITRTTIFVAVYSLLLGLPFAVAIGLRSWLMDAFGANWWTVPSGLMAIAATTGPFIYIYFQRKAEDMLLKEQRHYQEILKQAAQGMPRIRNLNKLLSFCVDMIMENVRISHAAIYLFEEKRKQYILKAGRGLMKDQPVSIQEMSGLVQWFKAHKDPIIYEEVKRRSEDNAQPIFNQLERQMRDISASLLVPEFLEDKLLGILLLGSKLSGKTYTTDDLNIFSVLASQSALAIENASLYENIETQVKERTKELVDVQKQLVHAEKLATVGTLAGGVAHEINNPLTAILTNVQMLLSDNELDRESLEMIEEATKRCKTIVQKLMTFSQKPMANTMMYQVNILDVIQHTVNFLKFQLEQENITLEVQADKNTYLVLANHDELGQVLTNIVLNAKDAIRQVKKSGTVYITISENENQTLISIKDDGAGIPKTILNRIFDPFFTTKEVGKGLGLGLSICQTIIEKHKGKILVETQINKGSTFIIQLPKFKQQPENTKTLK